MRTRGMTREGASALPSRVQIAAEPLHGATAIRFRAMGTNVIALVTAADFAPTAVQLLHQELQAVEMACSRFRADSELAGLHRAQGRPVQVSDLLFEIVSAGSAAAELTGGAVDPTVCRALEALGYDRDFDLLQHQSRPVVPPQRSPGTPASGDARRGVGDPAQGISASAPSAKTPSEHPAGWWVIELDAATRTVRVPAGVRLDFGATAKALAADRAATALAAAGDCGVLVSLGGDIAVAGDAPAGGWPIGVAADAATPVECVDEVVAISAGGLATSSTTVRVWHNGDRRVHHIIDPFRGDCASEHWQLVTVAAPTCLLANAASTAAIVWGPEALDRLAGLGFPTRLVRADGTVVTACGWPAPAQVAIGPTGSPLREAREPMVRQ